MKKKNQLLLRRFFPEEYLRIIEIIDSDTKIIIRLKSVTSECECPGCKTTLTEFHGTYERKVQDLPILGKNVQLLINVREYHCDNEECSVTTVTESYDGFLDPYSRMTERCADFICMLAMETSCEGSARICKAMNINVSGDTIIRLLTKRFEMQEESICGTVIGVDDFALKKRHRYGTIIVDEATRKPITLLEGRDGKGLKDWLQNNKHIKAVTRDRASAYAAAIQEVLPDAMQIADRFHLHQNLLEAIQETLKTVVPISIKIPKAAEAEESVLVIQESEGDDKKRACQCGKLFGL
ncbi:MAG: ISL3 family transposase [Synergistaceae bacterium]|nr:ISL3 family transposase [Synergistaceae bacterium]